MNWGKNEFDHVRPLSIFGVNNPNQLQEATLYSNIQSLLKRDNRSKGSK